MTSIEIIGRVFIGGIADF